MDFISRFVPSKDTRNYLHSIHHEFNDLEKGREIEYVICSFFRY